MSTPGKLKKSCTMLVTRPVHQAAQLIELIQSAGGHAYKFPAIEIRSVGNRSALLTEIESLPECDYAFFISPNAVTYGIDAISESIGALPQSLRLACIGAGTIAALKDAGYQCHVSPVDNFNSEALLDLPELRDIKDKRIVIFRGNGGRDKLRNELVKRGAHVEYIACYERAAPTTDIKPVVSELANNNIDIISFTSAGAARNIVAMLGDQAGDNIFNLPVIAVSQRIADVCRSLGFKAGIIVAETPNNEAIVNCMIEWQQKNL